MKSCIFCLCCCLNLNNCSYCYRWGIISIKYFNSSFSVLPCNHTLFLDISSKQLLVVLTGSECPVTIRITCKFSSLYCIVKTPWKNYGTWSSSWWTSFTWLSGYSNLLNWMLKVPCVSLFTSDLHHLFLQTDTKKISAVSIFFETMPYRLNETTGYIDYDQVLYVLLIMCSFV